MVQPRPIKALQQLIHSKLKTTAREKYSQKDIYWHHWAYACQKDSCIRLEMTQAKTRQDVKERIV
uniref:Uncharacterized protein n=1 Tax=Rhizophora mucronata TaxID=61149 RepID=A0A2P2P916_RHIMU